MLTCTLQGTRPQSNKIGTKSSSVTFAMGAFHCDRRRTPYDSSMGAHSNDILKFTKFTCTECLTYHSRLSSLLVPPHTRPPNIQGLHPAGKCPFKAPLFWFITLDVAKLDCCSSSKYPLKRCTTPSHSCLVTLAPCSSMDGSFPWHHPPFLPDGR